MPTSIDFSNEMEYGSWALIQMDPSFSSGKNSDPKYLNENRPKPIIKNEIIIVAFLNLLVNQNPPIITAVSL